MISLPLTITICYMDKIIVATRRHNFNAIWFKVSGYVAKSDPIMSKQSGKQKSCWWTQPLILAWNWHLSENCLIDCEVI
jgi:hypothetical protein